MHVGWRKGCAGVSGDGMWPITRVAVGGSRRRSTRQHNMPRRACIPAAEAQQVAARGCLAEARRGRLIPHHQLAHAALSSLGPALCHDGKAVRPCAPIS